MYELKVRNMKNCPAYIQFIYVIVTSKQPVLPILIIFFYEL